MIIDVNNPTYQYKKPILFCGEEYSDSKSFVEAILEHWDDAITAYKSGEWSDMWNEHTDLDKAKALEMQSLFHEPYEEMWLTSGEKNVDVLFTKALHYIEPAMYEIPCFISNQYQLELWAIDKYQDYFEKEFVCEESLADDSKRSFDQTKEGSLYAYHMIKEAIFSTYGCETIGRMSELFGKLQKNEEA